MNNKISIYTTKNSNYTITHPCKYDNIHRPDQCADCAARVYGECRKIRNGGRNGACRVKLRDCVPPKRLSATLHARSVGFFSCYAVIQITIQRGKRREGERERVLYRDCTYRVRVLYTIRPGVKCLQSQSRLVFFTQNCV